MKIKRFISIALAFIMFVTPVFSSAAAITGIDDIPSVYNLDEREVLMISRDDYGSSYYTVENAELYKVVETLSEKREAIENHTILTEKYLFNEFDDEFILNETITSYVNYDNKTISISSDNDKKGSSETSSLVSEIDTDSIVKNLELIPEITPYDHMDDYDWYHVETRQGSQGLPRNQSVEILTTFLFSMAMGTLIPGSHAIAGLAANLYYANITRAYLTIVAYNNAPTDRYTTRRKDSVTFYSDSTRYHSERLGHVYDFYTYYPN